MKKHILAKLLALVLIVAPIVLATNNPGHDTLYIEENGTTGTINITNRLTAENLLWIKSYLDILGNGTSISGTVSRPTIQATATELDILTNGLPLYLNRYGAGTVYTGSPGVRTDLNVSGNIYIYNPTGTSTLTIGNVNVCLANGTNCQAISGSNSGGGWTNTTTYTTTTLQVNITNTLTTNNITIRNLTSTNCDVKAYTDGTLYCGTDATGSGGDGTGGWTNNTQNTTTTLNVGIGITNPEYKLHIYSTGVDIAKFYSTASGDSAARIVIDSESNNAGFSLRKSNSAKWSNAMYQADSGNLEYTLYNDQTSSPALLIDGNTNKFSINASTFSQALHVQGNTNVTGIIYTPQICLAGDCKTAWPSGGAGNITSKGTTGYVALFQNNTLLNNSQIYQSGSNIGIGTTSPGAVLTIIGANATTGDSPQALFVQAGSSANVGAGGIKSGGITLIAGAGTNDNAGGTHGGSINLTAGNGGWGVDEGTQGGDAGHIYLTAGDAGCGETCGIGGNIIIKAGMGQNAISPGRIEIIGGNTSNSFSANGNVYIVGGTGGNSAGYVILGTTSSGASRGNIGIGTAAPSTKLDVNGTTNTSNLIIGSATAGSCDLKAYTNGSVYCGTDATGSGGGGNITSQGTTGYIPLFQNNTQIYNSAIYQNGTNIGIGILGSNKTLHVYNPDASDGAIAIFETGLNGGSVNVKAKGYCQTIGFKIDKGTDNAWSMWSEAACSDSRLYFSTGGFYGTKIITLNSSGTLGIGTINAVSTLDVNGTATVNNITVRNLTSANCDVKAYTDGTLYCGSDATGSGGDGTGGWTNTTTTSTNLLKVVVNSSSGAGSFIVQNTSGSTHFFVNGSNGNIGVGTVAPSEKFTVAGNIFQTPNASMKLAGYIDDDTNFDGTYSVLALGKYAYVGSSGGLSFGVIDISNPKNPQLVGRISNPNISGISEITLAGSYVAFGGWGGGAAYEFGLIDVSNPVRPTLVSYIKNSTAIPRIERMASSGNYIYAAEIDTDPTKYNFIIIDISNASSPYVTGFINNDTDLDTLWDISLQGTYAYLTPADTTAGQANFVIINVSNVSNPYIIGRIDNDTALANGNRLAVSGRYVYAALYDSNTSNANFAIIDISNVTNPTIVSTINDDTTLFNLNDIQVYNQYAYVTSESNNYIIIDVSNVSNPFVVSVFNSSTVSNFPTDLQGKYAYLAAYGTGAGVTNFAVIDIPGIDAPTASIGSISAEEIRTQGNIYTAGSINTQAGIAAGAQGITSQGKISAPQICLAGDCKTSWPSSGTADGSGGWTNTTIVTATALNVNLTSGNLTMNSNRVCWNTNCSAYTYFNGTCIISVVGTTQDQVC